MTNNIIWFTIDLEQCSSGVIILIKLENQKAIIFNTAKEIVLSEEIQSFSIRMISRKCNIGIGTIYKYYGTKTDILIDITKDFWISYITFIKSNVNQSDDVIDRIEFYYESLVTFSKKFNYLILSKELSGLFRNVGKIHHNNAQDMFKSIVFNDLIMTLSITDEKAVILADFICNNLVSTITMDTYEFITFKNILHMLLDTSQGD